MGFVLLTGDARNTPLRPFLSHEPAVWRGVNDHIDAHTIFDYLKSISDWEDSARD